MEEIEERGIVFDSSNYDMIEFSAGIATESGTVAFNIPVSMPKGHKIVDEEPEPSGGVALALPAPESRDIDMPTGTSLPENMFVITRDALQFQSRSY